MKRAEVFPTLSGVVKVRSAIAFLVLTLVALVSAVPSQAEPTPLPSPSTVTSPSPTLHAFPAAAPSPPPSPGEPLSSPNPPSAERVASPPPLDLPTPESIPADVPDAPLSVNEAVRIALVHQANLAIFDASVRAAQGHTQQVRAGLMPSVVVSGIGTDLVTATGPNNIPVVPLTTVPVAGGRGTGVIASTINGYTFTAQAQQLLWDFNHTRNLVRQAVAEEHEALQALEATRQDLVLSVKQSYFIYAQNVRLAAVLQTNLENQQAHLEIADARYKAGTGIPSDVLVVQTAVGNAGYALNQAQNAVSNSRASLALLLGIDPRTPIQISMETPESVAPTDPNQLFRDALANRPEVLQALARVQASHYGLSAARTNNAPSLSAVADFIQQGGQLTNLNSQIFSVGLQLAWPIFDGGYTAGGVRIARANDDIARAQLTLARQNAIYDVAQALLNLKTARRQLDLSGGEVKTAEESVRIVGERYKVGLSTIVDLLNAQQALVLARTNQVNAQIAVSQAQAALDRAVGKKYL